MNNNDSKLQKHITPWKIIKQSRCLTRTIIGVLIVTVSLLIFLATYAFGNWNEYALKIIGGFALALALAFAILTIREIILIVKIFRRKYYVRRSPILSIKFRNPYEALNNSDKVIELIKLKIVVDHHTADQFKVGDMVVVVFVSGIRPPILIAKEDAANK